MARRAAGDGTGDPDAAAGRLMTGFEVIGVGHLQLAGDLAGDAARLLSLPELPSSSPLLRLDLDALELLDGIATVALIDRLRELRRHCDRLDIHGAPQALAHCLYRVQRLDDPGLQLIDTREDEGAAW